MKKYNKNLIKEDKDKEFKDLYHLFSEVDKKVKEIDHLFSAISALASSIRIDYKGNKMSIGSSFHGNVLHIFNQLFHSWSPSSFDTFKNFVKDVENGKYKRV